MESEEERFFTRLVSDLSPGIRYGYSLDGGPTRPDPCSSHQPDGVHRLSAIDEPEAFPWSAENPAIERGDLVLYELHIGTFTDEGTFDAAIGRLDDLAELGVNAIEVLPVAQFPGTRNWGYDGVHPYATQNTYGGPESFRRFIDEAHRRGLAVVLDVVFNHLGPEGNYLAEFGPYFSNRHPTPWGDGFNFDGPDASPVRTWVLDCVRQWIHDFRLDGLRLDAVHAMKDDSSPHILTDIQKTADEAAADRGGQCIVIAESLRNDISIVTPVAEGGLGVDAEWNEDLHHAISAWLTGERHGKYVDYGEVEDVERVFRETFHLSGRHSDYYGGPWGGPAGDIPGDRFVVSLQNHDHIGNRARGERIAVQVDETRHRLGACLTLLAPFLPMVFMGEEYAETRPFPFFCDFSDPDVIEGVRRGRKRDYGLSGPIPDPQGETTFASARLSWEWRDDPRRTRTRQLYRDLIRLRREIPQLRDFRNRSVRFHPDFGKSVLEIRRGAEREIACLFHLAEGEVSLPDELRPIWRSGDSGGPVLGSFETVVGRVL